MRHPKEETTTIRAALALIAILITSTIYVTACNTPQGDRIQIQPLPTPAPTASPLEGGAGGPATVGTPVVFEAPTGGSFVLPTIPYYRAEWVNFVLTKFDAGIFAQLQEGKKDMVRFCPKYLSLTTAQQKVAWLHLISAMTKYESGIDTKTGFYKVSAGMTESNGAYSQGLFQLTYGDKFCPTSKAKGDLNNPIVNLDCALKLMGYYVALDDVIAAGGYTKYGAPSPKGLARYWAVIRVPDSKSKHQLAEIIALSKKAPGCQ